MHESAVMIAKIMGPFLVIVGLWFLFCQDLLTKLRLSSEKNFGILYVAAVINVLIGLTIVAFYNVWALNWAITVTVLGWFAVVRGIYMMFFPGKFFGTKQPGGLVLKVYGLLPLIWGALLLVVAFYKK
ncbi:MAG: hypothetical protein JSS30_03500 [Verrucomicrobia bacterium]|nr:hypothetical protein [Verrucomicrobiota bacterium]